MKTKWIIFIICSGILLIGLFGLGMFELTEVRERYSLDDYTCEQIEGSIRDGSLIPMSKSLLSIRSFTVQEKFVYYNLFCIEVEDEEKEIISNKQDCIFDGCNWKCCSDGICYSTLRYCDVKVLSGEGEDK